MRKFLSTILALALAASLTSAYAAETPSSTEDLVAAYATVFISEVDDVEREVAGVRPMYDYTETTITGYYVTYEAGGEPAGYLVLDSFDAANPIVEFALDGNGIVPATYAETTAIVFEGGGRMYVKTRDGAYRNTLLDYETDVNGVQATASSPTRAAVEVGDYLETNAPVVTSQKLVKDVGSMALYPTQATYDSSGAYANNCGPTAAANILLYWYNSRGMTAMNHVVSGAGPSLTDKGRALHDRLFATMRTNATAPGTFVTDVVPGLESVLGLAGTTWAHTTVDIQRPDSADWTAVQNILSKDVPVVLFMQTESGSSAHFMFCHGYATTSAGTGYLCVMDGTRQQTRYIRFLNNAPKMWACGVEIKR